MWPLPTSRSTTWGLDRQQYFSGATPCCRRLDVIVHVKQSDQPVMSYRSLADSEIHGAEAVLLQGRDNIETFRDASTRPPGCGS